MGFPSPGGAIRSIDRSGPPITRGHEMGKHLSTSVSHPHFEPACTLTYVRNERIGIRWSSAIARHTQASTAADALTRTHFRHASLNNGINRLWRVINCRCPPDMTVYSFVRRANVPNICGIPSVGLGLKSDPVFSTCFTHTRVRTRVDSPVRVKAPSRANESENTRLKKKRKYCNVNMIFIRKSLFIFFITFNL